MNPFIQYSSQEILNNIAIMNFLTAARSVYIVVSKELANPTEGALDTRPLL